MSSMLMDDRSTAPPGGGVDLAGVDLAGLSGRGLVAVAERVLTRLGDQLLGGGIDDGQLLGSVVALQRVETMVFAERLRRVSEVDQRQAHVIDGSRTAAEWLASRCGLTRAEAHGQVDVARALLELPATAARLARGELSPGQAVVAARTLRQTQAAAAAAAKAAAEAAAAQAAAAQRAARTAAQPEDATDSAVDAAAGDGGDERAEEEAARAAAEEAREAAERAAQAEAAERAARLDQRVADSPARDRNQLRDDLDDWAHREVGDGLAARQRAAYAARKLWIGQRADGLVGVNGQLDAIAGAQVTAAIDALARPTGTEDTRTFAQRRADALFTLAAQHLGVPPRSGPDGDRDRPRSGAGDPGPPKAGAGGDPQPQARAHNPTPDGPPQPATAPTGPPPGKARTGPPAQVLLLTTPDALHDTTGAAPSQLDGVGAVCNATARQICCDAETTQVTMTRNGQILDVGRSRRQPTTRQRTAVIARDRGCVGCGAAVSRCQVHHVASGATAA